MSKLLKKTPGVFRISAYEIGTNLDVLSNLESWPEIRIQTGTAVVGICMLCQYRTNFPAWKSKDIDQLPSYRFYKKKLVTGDPGKVLAFALAATQPETLPHIPVLGPDELEPWLMGIYNSFGGSNRSIQTPNVNNIQFYIPGLMSRIIGLMGSCPSTSFDRFGIPNSMSSWKIADCLRSVPNESLSSLDPQTIITAIREQIYGENVPPSPLEFDESPLNSSLVTDGYLPLEREIFGEALPIRLGNRGPKTSSVDRSTRKRIPDEILTATLTPFQLAQYKAALAQGKMVIVDQLTVKIDAIIDKADLSDELLKFWMEEFKS